MVAKITSHLKVLPSRLLTEFCVGFFHLRGGGGCSYQRSKRTKKVAYAYKKSKQCHHLSCCLLASMSMFKC